MRLFLSQLRYFTLKPDCMPQSNHSACNRKHQLEDVVNEIVLFFKAHRQLWPLANMLYLVFASNANWRKPTANRESQHLALPGAEYL